MRSHNLKILLGGLAVLLTVMACNIQTNATNPPPTVPVALDTTSPVPPTVTQTVPALPVVASPPLQFLDMLDINNGWALTVAAVLRTTNGGATWYNVTPTGLNGPPASSFFLDAVTGWVAVNGGNPTSGTLFHTTDGGVTWTSVPVPFGGGSIKFVDSLHGWELIGLSTGMSNEAVAIFRTSNGGTTWSQVFINDPGASGSSDSLPLIGDKNGITALDANHAWVTGSEPENDFFYIYTTHDGGQTWSAQNPSLPADYSGAMTIAFPPSFFSATEGVLPVVLVSDTVETAMYISHDAGQTWTASEPIASNGLVSLVSQMDFFVWDGGSKLYASHNGGTSWAMVTTNITVQDNLQDNLMAFQFVNVTTGWVLASESSNHQTLYKTTDGGATWVPLIP